VRESRALAAAKRLGLIVEHELTDERFYYVMRYVPGEPLGLVTQRLHGLGEGSGLARKELREVLSYATDLLQTLRHYHDGGLWHKDVKPDNIIIHDGRAHLVDFGLITPLRSSMTLTTHGTEYFRDPEMVRMALKGVKVHEVDGAKFDLYAAGAVLYSVIENSFPAHGGLSQITRRCPESLRWVVRRAMADYDKRYDSAAAMLADLEAIARAEDPFLVKPVGLPSMGGSAEPMEFAAEAPPEHHEDVAQQAKAAVESERRYAAPPRDTRPAGSANVRAGTRPPRLKVTNWWTGAYEVEGESVAPSGPAPVPPPRPAVAARTTDPRLRRGRASASSGLSAPDQVKRARGRAAQARARAHARMQKRRANHASGMNLGAGFAVLVFLGAIGAAGAMFFKVSQSGVSVSEIKADRDEALAISGNGGEAPGAQFTSHHETGDASFTVIAVETPFAERPPRLDPPVDLAEEEPAIVVLRDQSVMPVALSRRFSAQVADLEEQGFEMIGAGAEGDAERIAAENDLIADLRKSIGLHPFQSGHAARAVRDWLDGHAETAMVLWVGKTGEDDATFWVIGRRGLHAETLRAVYDALAGEAGALAPGGA
jgi:hypothetical protein